MAELPTAEDYSRIVKEKNEQHARADAAELARDATIADRDYWQRRFKTMEDYANAMREQQDLIERIVPEAARQKCADYDEHLKAVQAAFAILGKEDDEPYETCARRVMSELHGMRDCATERAARIDDLEEDRDAAVTELARVRDDLAWSKRLYKDLTEALLPGDNGYLNCMAEVRRLKGVDAELARVREALNVLLREGGKGGAV